jgi:hypothetical protein
MSASDGRGFNCFFPMPFNHSGRIEIANDGAKPLTCFYYVDYETYETPQHDIGLFHAQWRRENPTDGWGKTGEPHGFRDRAEFWKRPNLDGAGNYVILEATGRGHYVGCNLNIDVFERQQNDWYGEGDDMIFIDGELRLRGTGTEDYFCGSYNFENQATHQYQPFSTPYSGLSMVTKPDGRYDSQQRFNLYRWHITDPIRFEQDLKVTIQALGWRDGGRYLPLQDDIASVVYWYQAEPHGAFPKLPSKDELEIQ